MLFEIKIFFFESKILISPVLAITIFTKLLSLSFVLTVLIFSNSITPSNLALIFALTAIFDAVPPTWKVLKVNCVPGSPIDWAAITPTASPLLTKPPVARFLP